MSRSFLKAAIFAVAFASAAANNVFAAEPFRQMSGSGDQAEEMLQDGIDALDDGRPDLARKIFETLRVAYPRSEAARSAQEELSKIGNGNTPAAADADVLGDPRPVPSRGMTGADRDEQLKKLRMRFLTEVGDRVFFAENSAGIGGRARAVIEAQARWLKQAKRFEVTIIGRADDGGNAAQSEALALSRARAVEAMLVEKGISPTAIHVETHGAADPVATCKSALCQAENRHVETFLRFAGEPGQASLAPEAAGPRNAADASAPRSSKPLAR